MMYLKNCWVGVKQQSLTSHTQDIKHGLPGSVYPDCDYYIFD